MTSEENQEKKGDLNVLHCWRCKTSDHEAGDKFCPKMKLHSSSLQTDRLRWSFEDPMYQYLQDQHKREKQERIRQLQSLLDDSTSSSSSSDSDVSDKKQSGKGKKKKKRKKKKSKDKFSKESDRHRQPSEFDKRKRHNTETEKHEKHHCDDALREHGVKRYNSDSKIRYLENTAKHGERCDREREQHGGCGFDSHRCVNTNQSCGHSDGRTCRGNEKRGGHEGKNWGSKHNGDNKRNYDDQRSAEFYNIRSMYSDDKDKKNEENIREIQKNSRFRLSKGNDIVSEERKEGKRDIGLKHKYTSSDNNFKDMHVRDRGDSREETVHYIQSGKRKKKIKSEVLDDHWSTSSSDSETNEKRRLDPCEEKKEKKHKKSKKKHKKHNPKKKKRHKDDSKH